MELVLDKRCAKCGSKALPTLLFCPRCGTDLGESATAVVDQGSSPTLGILRRFVEWCQSNTVQVTIAFCTAVAALAKATTLYIEYMANK